MICLDEEIKKNEIEILQVVELLIG